MRKPVLILNLAKYYGGSAVRTLQTAKMLHGIGYPACTVVLHGSPLHEKFIHEQLPVKALTHKRGDPRCVLALHKLIGQNQYQVIDTHNPQSHLWGWLAAKMSRSCKTICTVHGCYGEAEKGWRSKVYDGVLKITHDSETTFIAVSDSVCQYLKKLRIREPYVHYIENAVLHEPASAAHETIKTIAGWPPDSIVIAVSARLEPVKGLAYLIEAFAHSVMSQPRLKLFIMGTGRLRSTLEEQCNSLNLLSHVHFAGFRQDVTKLLSSADIFCLPSLSEGLPFAVLEAAMAGLPLVLSNVGGMAEFFRHKESALLFPAKNVQELSGHLISLASDPECRTGLGQSAFDLVSERFSSNRMFEQTLNVYNR